MSILKKHITENGKLKTVNISKQYYIKKEEICYSCVIFIIAGIKLKCISSSFNKKPILMEFYYIYNTTHLLNI